VRNTRIMVWGLVNSRSLGATDEQIMKNIVVASPDVLFKPDHIIAAALRPYRFCGLSWAICGLRYSSMYSPA
jgi:hypothetical protein